MIINTKKLLDHKIECAFLIISMLIAFSFCMISLHKEPTISRDGTYYVSEVQKMYDSEREATGNKIYRVKSIKIVPFFLMKKLMACGMAAEQAGIFLNVLCGSMLPLIIFFIALEISNNKQVALIPAGLIAVHPAIIEFSRQPQREAIYLFLCGLMILFLIKGIKNSRKTPWILSGLFLGVSSLTRIETFEFVPIVGLYFLIIFIIDRKNLKINFRNAILFLLAGVVSLGGILVVTGELEHIGNKYKSYLDVQQKMFKSKLNNAELK